MKDYGIVQGSAAQAKPLVINVDTVYVHTDIKDLGNGLFEYHEIQYTKDEYINENTAKAIALESEVQTLTTQVNDLSAQNGTLGQQVCTLTLSNAEKDNQITMLGQQVTMLNLKGGTV